MRLCRRSISGCASAHSHTVYSIQQKSCFVNQRSQEKCCGRARSPRWQFRKPSAGKNMALPQFASECECKVCSSERGARRCSAEIRRGQAVRLNRKNAAFRTQCNVAILQCCSLRTLLTLCNVAMLQSSAHESVKAQSITPMRFGIAARTASADSPQSPDRNRLSFSA